MAESIRTIPEYSQHLQARSEQLQGCPMEMLGDISQPTPTDGNINYITGQYYAYSTLCYGNCASHSSFALGSRSMSGFPGALYKESSNACKVFDEMPFPVYGCTQAQYEFSQIPIAVPRSPGIINPMNAQPVGDHRMHGEISEQYGTSGYACAFIPETNTSAQELTHEVAMPKVEAIDDLYSVTPHLKGQISEQQPHVIQELLAQIQANLAALSQDLKHMKQSGERTWDCSKPTAASQPNPPTQEVIKVFDETPTYDVYDDEVSDCSNGFINLVDGNLEQQQDEEGKKYMEQTSKSFNKNSKNILLAVATEFAFSDHGVDFLARSSKLTNEKNTLSDSMPVYDVYDDKDSACPDVFDCTLEQQPPQAEDKASEKALTEDVADFTFTNGPDFYIERSTQLGIENTMIPTSMSDSQLHYTHRKGERLESVNCTKGLETPQLQFEQAQILLSGTVLPEAMMAIPPSSKQRSYWLGPVLLKLPWDPGDINTRVKGMQMVAYNSIRLKSLETFSEYYSEVFSRDVASNFTAETEISDVVLHDPGIKTYSYMYRWLEISSEIEEPLQLTQGTLSLALHYQLPVSIAPCLWDLGIASLLYQQLHILPVIQHDARVPVQQQIQSKSIISLWAFSFEKDAQMQWDPGKDNKKFNYLIPALCNSRFNAMHYCQIFEKCINGIALWLIHFQPP